MSIRRAAEQVKMTRKLVSAAHRARRFKLRFRLGLSHLYLRARERRSMSAVNLTKYGVAT